MPKFTELQGASPPGPAGGLTAAPRPPAVFLVPMAAPLPKCFRRACLIHEIALYYNVEQCRPMTISPFCPCYPEFLKDGMFVDKQQCVNKLVLNNK